MPAFPPQRLQTEKEFITDAIKGDNSEIALGRLTVATSASDPVKAFGQTLIDDHSNAKTEVSAVATKVNVSPPGEMSSEAQTEVTKLKQLSGRDFYTEFACYMVEDHQKDIAEFKEADGGHGPVQQLAAQTVLTLEKHLRLAKSLSATK